MAVPNFESMMLPLLKFLKDGRNHSMSEAEEYLANFFKLTHQERSLPKPSGGESLFHNRLHWAKFYLKKAGLLDNPPRSHFKITTRGLGVLKEGIDKMDIGYLKKFQEFLDFVDG